MAIKSKQSEPFECAQCGARYGKWVGQCRQCFEWNTIVEAAPSSRAARSAGSIRSKTLSDFSEAASGDAKLLLKPQFLQRLLGREGIPAGSVLLIAGEPGIGKSTVLWQMLLNSKLPSLYVSTEESMEQVALRFRRLSVAPADHLRFLSTAGLDEIMSEISNVKPKLVVVDSLSMLGTSRTEDRASFKEASEALVQYAKEQSFVLWMVGHINKEGEIAGPKWLEHLVDTVIFFSAPEGLDQRILQVTKNRFGPAGEVSALEMTAEGLKEISEPVQFWGQRKKERMMGCAISPLKFGSRIRLVEIQALTVPSSFAAPRRSASGFDQGRLHLLLAVLEKKLRIPMSRHDVFVNVVGGVRVEDPAADLAVIVALASAFFEKDVDLTRTYAGEVGLTGELRALAQWEERVRAISDAGRAHLIGGPVRARNHDKMEYYQAFEGIEAVLQPLLTA